jgi:outer membrane protein OmpA-like peptidoglycan-associated protein/opacity protein-like surface antigen
MKTIKAFLAAALLMLCFNVVAQQMPPEGVESVAKRNNKMPANTLGRSSNFSISAGIGIANYFGDLMEYNRFFSQPGYSFSIGAGYAFSNNFSLRLDAGAQQVHAADSKNKGQQYRERNLSFKSNVYDVSLSAEYTLFNINRYKISPFLSAGVGMMFFNPFANDAAGNKQFLRELGTEGQGLAAYPDRKIYSKSAIEFPLGIGFKIAASQKITLKFEFNYRITGTDYLDDVSFNGYPDKALLDARNPVTSAFTYRGPGPYPANLNLPRGNPKDKDGYYTTQFKVVYGFKKNVKVKAAKVVQVPVINTLPKDRDGDGTADSIDRCPDIAGTLALRGCPDTDHDGIADRDDKCPEVAGDYNYDGCPVPDTDGDGIKDDADKCKTVKGTIENNGCPAIDTDEDGIADIEDKCPEVKGSVENRGCPIQFIEGAELINITPDSMTYRIYFDVEMSNLTPDAFKVLKTIVELLKADNSLSVSITGHADSLGTPKANLQVSAERAKIAKDYFLSYFITADRIKSSYYGSKRPVSNLQPWMNRRVEITIIKKK